jgi:hypothetical protein
MQKVWNSIFPDDNHQIKIVISDALFPGIEAD